MNLHRTCLVSLLLVVPAVAVACGGSIGIGTVTSSDTEDGSTPDSGGDATRVQTLVCSGAAAPTMVYDGTTDAVAPNISDFAGDGRYLYVAHRTNPGTDQIPNGRITRIDAAGAVTELVSENGVTINALAVASGQLAYATGVAGVPTYPLKRAPLTGGPGVLLSSAAYQFDAVPDDPAIVFAAVSPTLDDTVYRWLPGAASAIPMFVFYAPFQHVAVGFGLTVASAQGGTDDSGPMEYAAVMGAAQPPKLNGMGTADTYGSLEGGPSSTLAYDGKNIYVMGIDTSPFSHPLNQDAGPAKPVPLWAIPPATGGAASSSVVTAVGLPNDVFGRLQVDADYVYIERATAVDCAGSGPCPPVTSITRVKKATGIADDVKHFQGALAGDSSAARARFAVDGCFLYWLDGQKIYRQSKASLTSL